METKKQSHSNCVLQQLGKYTPVSYVYNPSRYSYEFLRKLPLLIKHLVLQVVRYCIKIKEHADIAWRKV